MKKGKRSCAKKHFKCRGREHDKWTSEVMFKKTNETPTLTSHTNPLIVLSEAEYKRMQSNSIELTKPRFVENDKGLGEGRSHSRKMAWDVQQLPKGMESGRNGQGVMHCVAPHETIHFIASLDCGLLDLLSSSSTNKFQIVGAGKESKEN